MCAVPSARALDIFCVQKSIPLRQPLLHVPPRRYKFLFSFTRISPFSCINWPSGDNLSPVRTPLLELLLADSQALQRVEILTGDFEQTLAYAQGRTLFYPDPPYRPLSDTSSFNDYAKQPFNDDAQVRLKEFCDQVAAAGHNFMLSNSDCLGENGTDLFFDDLFQEYHIERVWAKRSVNAVASKRGKLTEILVHNYAVNQLRNAI